MRSVEDGRLTLRWRTLTGALLLAFTFVLFSPVAASATQLSTPDANGKYAHCNIKVYLRSSVSSSPLIQAACQYAMENASHVVQAGAQLTNLTTNANYTCTSPCTPTSGSGAGNFTTSDFSLVNATGHAERWVNSAGTFGKTGNNITAFTPTTCTVSISGAGYTNQPCTIDSVTLNSDTEPLLPNDYYNGSSAGPVLDSAGTTTCSRTLTDTSAMTGSFTGTQTPTNATHTSDSWDWGDATAVGTTLTKNHTYGALSTMPTGGWTAVLSVTFTATAGHRFSDGELTHVTTCSLRVDFLHPEKSAVGSNDTSSTGDTDLDSCLPSGWSALNPLAWIGGLGCILKVLFIPDEATIDDLGTQWDTAQTKLPFSIVADLVTYIPDQLSNFQNELEAASPLFDHPSGAERPLICGDNSSEDWLKICGTGGDQSVVFRGTPFEADVGNPAVTAVRTVMLFAIAVLFAYACWRGASEILK